MRNLIPASLFVGALAILAGCTWVDTKPGADEVLQLPERRVQSCEKLGSVEVSVLARVAGLDRHEEEIEQDLQQLARNHAVEKDGDTIAALSEVKEGEQRYGVYRCEDRDTSPRSPQSQDEEEQEGVTVREYNGG